jgi:NitT/TauT family transport system substrate-binding protein
MLTRRQVAAFPIAALLPTASCQRRDPETVRVGYIPISESLPLFYGRSVGAFEREGLNVEPVALDGGAKIIEGMAAGSLDFGISNYVSLMLARESGLDFRLVVGCTVESRQNPQHAMLVKQDSPLTAVGLTGRRIAVNTRRNINELFVRAFLRQNGVDPDSATLVEVPFPRMVTTLESNAIDAAGAIEPFVTFSVRSNLTRSIGHHVVDVEDNVPITGWLASSTYTNGHRDIVTRFARAMQHSLESTQAEPAGARALLPSFTSLTATDAASIPLPTYVPDTPPVQLLRLVQRVQEAGWITSRGADIDHYLATQ